MGYGVGWRFSPDHLRPKPTRLRTCRCVDTLPLYSKINYSQDRCHHVNSTTSKFIKFETTVQLCSHLPSAFETIGHRRSIRPLLQKCVGLKLCFDNICGLNELIVMCQHVHNFASLLCVVYAGFVRVL
jgi:hypothetical protein